MQPAEETLPESGPAQQTPCCSSARWWWAVVLVSIAVGYFGYRYVANLGSTSRATSHPGVGSPVPAMRFAPLVGADKEVSTSSLRGNVAVINFWGTWCPPCRREFPHLVALGKKLASEPRFRLVAVSCGSNVESELRQETADFLQRQQAELPVYWDPDNQARAEVDRTIGFDGYPTTLVVDAKGVIRGVIVGYTPGDETVLEHLVRTLLDEAAG
jgi:thiol-disulfide isomerase/thioredoxin